MEISEVKRRVVETIERSRRRAGERRARVDQAGRDYDEFLDRVAIPIFRQISNVLRAQGYAFTVFTPGGSVRLAADRGAQDFVELSLDTGGDEPHVVGHSSRARGHRVVESERPVAGGDPATLTEDDVLLFVLKELEPLVER
jgi:hypothetical protein